MDRVAEGRAGCGYRTHGHKIYFPRTKIICQHTKRHRTSKQEPIPIRQNRTDIKLHTRLVRHAVRTVVAHGSSTKHTSVRTVAVKPGTRLLWSERPYNAQRGWDSTPSTVKRLRAGRPRFDSRQRQGFFSSSQLLHQPWRPPSLLTNGHRELFPRQQRSRGVKLTTHPHLVLRLRMRGATPPLPDTSLYGMVRS